MNPPPIPDSSASRNAWLLPVGVGLAVLVGLLIGGWIGPDIDVWYGVGFVRALRERPLTPESLGHVPKLGHLLALAPAVAFGATPERYLAAMGIVACGGLMWAHARWAAASNLPAARLVALLFMIPLVWRATLDGGSVAWGWALVLVALQRPRTMPVVWCLAAAALFRPEIVGVGLALGALRLWRGDRSWWRVILAPLAAGLAGTAVVDWLWTGRLGASSIAHAIFESATLEQVRGRWGFLDTGHAWSHFGIPIIVLAAIGAGFELYGRSAERAEVRSAEPMVELLAAALGFSLVTIANVATGGTLFVRFLLPWASVIAASACLFPLGRVPWRRFMVWAALLVTMLPGWLATAPEFLGTYPSGPAMLLARQLARQTAPELTVAMDAGVRAVSLGSGARPWKTTPWVLESSETACRSQVIVARGAFLRRIGPTLERCGPWKAFIMDSLQTRVDLQVLLARRGP